MEYEKGGGLTSPLTRFDTYCLADDEHRILVTIRLAAGQPVGLVLTSSQATSLWRSLDYPDPFDLAAVLDANRDYYDLGVWRNQTTGRTLRLGLNMIDGGVWDIHANGERLLELTPIRNAGETPRRLETACLDCLESQPLRLRPRTLEPCDMEGERL